MAKSDLLFLAIVASIPIQLNKFFLSHQSLVIGIPVDYRAIALYFSDFLVVGYFVFFFKENFKKIPKIFFQSRYLVGAILVFNFYLIFSSFIRINESFIPLWKTLKIVEFSLLAICAKSTFEKKNVYQWTGKILLFSIIWETLLVFGEFFLQRSLGLWFLGERAFDSTTVSIAHTQIFGKFLLRPYGTFPHPNVLAAFLVIALIFVNKQLFSKINPFKLIAIFLTFGALVAVYSQAAFLAISLALITLAKSFKQVLIGSVALIVIILFFLKTLTDNQLASIAERLLLGEVALDITLKNPLFGVGSGNFILELARFNISEISQVRLLQPVHNVFLLTLAENGLLSLLLLALILMLIFKRVNSKEKLTLATVLLIFASLDHFFWTLHQGQMLFWLTLGYIWSKQGN